MVENFENVRSTFLLCRIIVHNNHESKIAPLSLKCQINTTNFDLVITRQRFLLLISKNIRHTYGLDKKVGDFCFSKQSRTGLFCRIINCTKDASLRSGYCAGLLCAPDYPEKISPGYCARITKGSSINYVTLKSRISCPLPRTVTLPITGSKLT